MNADVAYLILAMDANFHLKNRLRGKQHDDTLLALGWGYIIEQGPYKEHLKGYVGEKDRREQKDTRLTTGLRCSGVGGVVCARHELMRPQGMGDLQKGERYANMDYILLSAVLGVTALYLAISYDIACQWRVNLATRMAAMPERLRLDLAAITVLFGLPVWHAAAHKQECQVQNSLSYTPGVGRTDGEGIERTWSHLNPLGWATKEMNVGARHDAIEDKVDHWNFEKNIHQVATFKQVDSTVKKGVRKEWQKKIDDWRADRLKPNPYKLEDGTEGPGEAMICRSLAQEEAREAAMGGMPLHAASVTSFLTAGLHLEETQRRIRDEAKGRTLPAADQNERLAHMRIAFFAKLAKFQKLQEVYTPAAVQELQEDKNVRDSDMAPPNAEEVKLYLPSSLWSSQREQGCVTGLPTMEGRLREGQCHDALTDMRCRLHAKRHLLNFRDSGVVVGQRAATKSQTLIEQIGERVEAAAAKYRCTRLALISLRGGAVCERFCELMNTDIQLDEEREIDAQARKKLASIGSARPRRLGTTLRDRRVSRRFKTAWDTSVATAVRMAVADNAMLSEVMSALTEAEREGQGLEEAHVNPPSGSAGWPDGSHTNYQASELQLAEKQTGCRGFAIITGSHVHDTIASHVIGSKASLKYFPEMQNMDGTTFEQSSNPCIRMNYVGYERMIIGEMGWELLGGPEMVPMQAPSKMGSGGAATIVTLWERLTNGTCRWERVSDQHHKEIRTKYKGVLKKGPCKTLATDKEEEEEPEEVEEDDEEEVAEPDPAPSKRKHAWPEAFEDDRDADSVAAPQKKPNRVQTQEEEGTPVPLSRKEEKEKKRKRKEPEEEDNKVSLPPKKAKPAFHHACTHIHKSAEFIQDSDEDGAGGSSGSSSSSGSHGIKSGINKEDLDQLAKKAAEAAQAGMEALIVDHKSGSSEEGKVTLGNP
ncbi:hypothetical protein C8R45DRAFT_933121 [Mycena sanguinolenta]|nr:hypothetical protein C8R45DRAFT_933121 [Mycena sanguinolenta]